MKTLQIVLTHKLWWRRMMEFIRWEIFPLKLKRKLNMKTGGKTKQ